MIGYHYAGIVTKHNTRVEIIIHKKRISFVNTDGAYKEKTNNFFANG